MERPKIKARFITFPIPKSLRRRKRTIALDIIKPLLEFPNIKEMVINKVKNKTTKNKIISGLVDGSVK